MYHIHPINDSNQSFSLLITQFNMNIHLKHFCMQFQDIYTYRSTAIARKLKMEPTNDIHSRESITSSSFFSEDPFFSSCPTSANRIIRVSQLLVRLAMVLKAARLQMKQCMGEWRFLFHMTATTTSRFSARLTAPMMKKTGTGTSTSGQSDWFTVVAFMVSYDGVFFCIREKS